MDEQILQSAINSFLNKEFPEPWGAFKATSKDGLEYIEMVNEKTDSRFIITIVKGQ